jgi:hypothetical protein
MRKMATAATTFAPGERDYIRRELDMFFSTSPTVAATVHADFWAHFSCCQTRKAFVRAAR